MTFESYGKYYWEITTEEAALESLKEGVPEKFKQREIDWIVGKLKTDISFLVLGYSDFYKNFVKRWTYSVESNSKIIGLMYRHKSKISDFIEILKYDDEYFTVSITKRSSGIGRKSIYYRFPIGIAFHQSSVNFSSVSILLDNLISS